MSVTCGFYNSVNHDRRYNAKQMSSIFDGIINDGVFMNIGDALATTANSGMVVNVGTGRAWFNHSWTYNDSVLPLTVPTSHSVLDRIDAVVLEVNESDEVRDNMIKIVTGTASSTPAKPALTNTKFVHQYALAYITVKGGATAITQANITINVGMSDCPYITGILKTISADVLFKQWSGEFGEWFENIKTQLSGDVAGNLQNQIGTLSELKTTIKTNLVAAMNSIVNKLGSKDISKIGDGTVTGAILAQNQSLLWSNVEIVSDSEFDITFVKCETIGFITVVRKNNGDANIDKVVSYPSKYNPITTIAVANYSSNAEAFIELKKNKLRIYAKQGHWVNITALYPLESSKTNES